MKSNQKGNHLYAYKDTIRRLFLLTLFSFLIVESYAQNKTISGTVTDFTGEPVVTVVAEEGQTYYAKWAQLFAITLELAGGTLAEGSTLYLKAVANVYDFMQSYTPTKEGLTFGAWFLGEKELPKNTRMTEE